eukprot:183012-Amphidinium_carterae.1
MAIRCCQSSGPHMGLMGAKGRLLQVEPFSKRRRLQPWVHRHTADSLASQSNTSHAEVCATLAPTKQSERASLGALTVYSALS